ncbi:hypothetical protein PBI_JACE_80 [Gordonia phage Jace]|uniref:Uncharacterized protein n=1 Tax=Gordonia phage Jace TaxID=2182360 RepID=A0A2U8UJA8_9CAUD|nr:hypothetical protein HOT28_gp80 [Gordonia phage Jace]AWN03700.1 hypothetical protein PBI_JACE_80 [Gordonia phage Jace]
MTAADPTICPEHTRRVAPIRFGPHAGTITTWTIDCAKRAPHDGSHSDSAGKEFP